MPRSALDLLKFELQVIFPVMIFPDKRIFVLTHSATKAFAGFEQKLCLLGIAKISYCKKYVFCKIMTKNILF